MDENSASARHENDVCSFGAVRGPAGGRVDLHIKIHVQDAHLSDVRSHQSRSVCDNGRIMAICSIYLGADQLLLCSCSSKAQIIS